MLSRTGSTLLYYSILSESNLRFFSASSCLYARKTRKQWDSRFPVSRQDVAPWKEGGSWEMYKRLPEDNLVAPTGVRCRQTNRFIQVKEMIPEFIVPDLTDFELKPYVSYLAKEITQSELTPKDIFNSLYAPDIEDDFREGKIKVENGKVILKDGTFLPLNIVDKVSD